MLTCSHADHLPRMTIIMYFLHAWRSSNPFPLMQRHQNVRCDPTHPVRKSTLNPQIFSSPAFFPQAPPAITCSASIVVGANHPTLPSLNNSILQHASAIIIIIIIGSRSSSPSSLSARRASTHCGRNSFSCSEKSSTVPRRMIAHDGAPDEVRKSSVPHLEQNELVIVLPDAIWLFVS